MDSPLPDDINASLARSLGAYVRRAPRHELPGRLRRFQGFRPQTLQRYRGELLAALDDEALREAVLEWLEEGSPGIAARDKDILRIACARGEGWREELLERAGQREAVQGHAGATGALEQALEEERERTRRSRAEARAAREHARMELDSERARGARLERDLRTTQAEFDELRGTRENEHRASAQEIEERDRQLRRRERELVKARQDKAILRAQLKDERRRSRELHARVEELERTRAVPEPPGARRAEEIVVPARAPRERRPLRAPPGRFEDDPDTLDEWLRAPAVRLLVDGYNVTLAEGGYGDLEPEQQRQRLRDDLERLATRRNVRTTLVFDGRQLPPGIARRRRGRFVSVHYSKPPEIADDHLVALLERLPPDPVVVVTDDRGLRGRVQALGATVAGADQLLSLLGR